MAKFQEFWSKLKYWQKGALIGAIVGILFNVFIFLFQGGNYGFGIDIRWIEILYLLPVVIASKSFQAELSFSVFISIVIWYFLIGLTLGFAYQIIKDKFPKYKVLLILIFIIILLIIIYWVTYLFLALILG